MKTLEEFVELGLMDSLSLRRVAAFARTPTVNAKSREKPSLGGVEAWSVVCRDLATGIQGEKLGRYSITNKIHVFGLHWRRRVAFGMLLVDFRVMVMMMVMLLMLMLLMVIVMVMVMVIRSRGERSSRSRGTWGTGLMTRCRR